MLGLTCHVDVRFTKSEGGVSFHSPSADGFKDDRVMIWRRVNAYLYTGKRGRL